MSGVTILEQQHVFVTLLDFRDGALLHGVIPNLNICTNLGQWPLAPPKNIYLAIVNPTKLDYYTSNSLQFLPVTCDGWWRERKSPR